MVQNIVLHRLSGKLYVGIFLGPLFCKSLSSAAQILLEEMSALILFAGIEGTDPVSDTGHVLVRELRCLNGQSVKGTCHDDKGPVSAFRRPVAECLIEIKQFSKCRPAAHVHDPRVILRPFFGKSVRAVVLQFVRQISAGHEDRLASEFVDRLPDHLPKPVMLGEGESGKTYAHYFGTCVFAADEVKRDHSTVVQPLVPLAHDAGRKTLPARDICQLVHELSVVLLVKTHLRGPEPPEVAFGAFSG